MLKYQIKITTDFMEYQRHGRPHRVSGAAEIDYDGTTMLWLEYGLYHRVDGPAVIRFNTISYYIRGKKYTP